jgi:hypothetical protein
MWSRRREVLKDRSGRTDPALVETTRLRERKGQQAILMSFKVALRGARRLFLVAFPIFLSHFYSPQLVEWQWQTGNGR